MKNTITTTFTSRDEAKAVITELDASIYNLSHGEYERPHYTARKVRGEDSYYIHATRYFYEGTCQARPSGALTCESHELCA